MCSLFVLFVPRLILVVVFIGVRDLPIAPTVVLLPIHSYLLMRSTDCLVSFFSPVIISLADHHLLPTHCVDITGGDGNKQHSLQPHHDVHEHSVPDCRRHDHVRRELHASHSLHIQPVPDCRSHDNLEHGVRFDFAVYKQPVRCASFCVVGTAL